MDKNQLNGGALMIAQGIHMLMSEMQRQTKEELDARDKRIFEEMDARDKRMFDELDKRVVKKVDDALHRMNL